VVQRQSRVGAKRTASLSETMQVILSLVGVVAQRSCTLLEQKHSVLTCNNAHNAACKCISIMDNATCYTALLPVADMSAPFVAFAKRAQWAWTPPKSEEEAMAEYYPVSPSGALAPAQAPLSLPLPAHLLPLTRIPLDSVRLFCAGTL